MKQYVCSICGYIYDEAAGGKWEDLPVDWKCPLCGADKSQFRENTEQAKPASRHRSSAIRREDFSTATLRASGS